MANLKIGTVVDQLWKRKQVIKDAEAEVKKLKKVLDEKSEEAIAQFGKEKLEGAMGKKAKASIKKSIVPNIIDWLVFCKYMSRNKRWDMVQRRPVVKAYRDMLADGKKVPGLESFTKVSLTLTEIK